MPEKAKNAYKRDHFPLCVSKLTGGIMDPCLLVLLFGMFMMPKMTFDTIDPGLVIVLCGIFMVTLGIQAGVSWIVCSWIYKKTSAEPDDDGMWRPLPVTMDDIPQLPPMTMQEIDDFLAFENGLNYDSDTCSVARTVREDFW